MRALKTALTTIRRTPYQALAAIATLTVMAFVVYLSSWLILGAHVVLRHFEGQPQLIAFFKPGTKPEALEQLQKNLQAQPQVKSVTLVTQEEALKLYKEENKDDPLLVQLVTSDILPPSIEVSTLNGQDLPPIKTELEKASGIDEVVLQQDLIDQLSRWTRTLRSLGIASAGVVALVAFINLTVLIGLKANSQKRAISIMRLIGASRWYVRFPFVLEGVVYGILSTAIGWLLSYAVLWWATPTLSELLTGIVSFPLPLAWYALQLAMGTAAFIIFGIFSSWVAVSRLMRV